jgi:hypothetical protein
MKDAVEQWGIYKFRPISFSRMFAKQSLDACEATIPSRSIAKHKSFASMNIRACKAGLGEHEGKNENETRTL